jgi:hypothetical protein
MSARKLYPRIAPAGDNSASDARKVLATFTSQKLNWLTGIAIDPRLKPYAFKVAFTIARFFNAKSGIAVVSDETLQDETSLSRRHVQRARVALKDTGWIESSRTRTATRYAMKSVHLDQMDDLRTQRRDGRNERREARRAALLNAPPKAQLRMPDAPPMAQ